MMPGNNHETPKIKRIRLYEISALFIISVVSLVAIANDAQAETSQMSSIIVNDDQDAVMPYYQDATAPNSIEGCASRWQDFNSDGDFNDASEQTDLTTCYTSINNDCTNAAWNAYLSCDSLFNQNAVNVYVFRNASATHVIGNYTFIFRTKDAIGAVISSAIFGIRIIPNDINGSQTINNNAVTSAPPPEIMLVGVILAILGLLMLMAIQGGIGFPFMASTGGIGLFLYLAYNISDIIAANGSVALRMVFQTMPIIPFAIGSWNWSQAYNTMRQSEK